ncbi:hypothetical protein R1sor_018513 [Riccia sorocarpa]|uniref:Uncharacterized protein n=1 Tax=Riccia sorocarpa TaxID=122646 RepID=A0ABD3IAD0_9MARC
MTAANGKLPIGTGGQTHGGAGPSAPTKPLLATLHSQQFPPLTSGKSSTPPKDAIGLLGKPVARLTTNRSNILQGGGGVMRQPQKRTPTHEANPAQTGTERLAAETRKKPFELARQAREMKDMAWRSATSSLDCIRKNIERFNHTEEKRENPYPELETEGFRRREEGSEAQHQSVSKKEVKITGKSIEVEAEPEELENMDAEAQTGTGGQQNNTESPTDMEVAKDKRKRDEKNVEENPLAEEEPYMLDWFWGEASSKFFFSLIRTQRAREDITCLRTEDGHLLVEQGDIIKELHRYYTNLFQEEERTEQDQRKLVEVLQLVDKQVTEEQNEVLIATPDADEVGELVKSLKREKAPGLDGMTAETLFSLGEAAEDDLLAMMVTFWDTGTITWKHQQGVIKLLPKEGDRQEIKNWRPISLLDLGCKLIAKLRASSVHRNS